MYNDKVMKSALESMMFVWGEPLKGGRPSGARPALQPGVDASGPHLHDARRTH